MDPAAPLDDGPRHLCRRQQPPVRVPERRLGGPHQVLAYALGGFYSALGGLALTATTGEGNPVPGGYTLLGIAAIVLGGVSLAGGRGGVVGPIIAVFILALVRSDLTFLGANPNLATVIQGLILIGVVMFGSIAAMRRSRA